MPSLWTAVLVLCAATAIRAAVTLTASPTVLTGSPANVTLTWLGLTAVPKGYSVALYFSDELNHIVGESAVSQSVTPSLTFFLNRFEHSRGNQRVDCV